MINDFILPDLDDNDSNGYSTDGSFIDEPESFEFGKNGTNSGESGKDGSDSGEFSEDDSDNDFETRHKSKYSGAPSSGPDHIHTEATNKYVPWRNKEVHSNIILM